eukprot:TRINITY_DN9037_c0_g1_i1.p1 TRINITY_DN9037_c0_g1~~TRINITY_DN9037_c0_g1_i1.p1  ORF type:complete len:173 (-),score=42.93 TRINITY_DN9037_c0_g1_i1:13-531(-)
MDSTGEEVRVNFVDRPFEYFHSITDWMDPNSKNALLFMTGESFDKLKTMQGIQYELDEKNPEDQSLTVIRKIDRKSPSEAELLEAFCFLPHKQLYFRCPVVGSVILRGANSALCCVRNSIESVKAVSAKQSKPSGVVAIEDDFDFMKVLQSESKPPETASRKRLTRDFDLTS